MNLDFVEMDPAEAAERAARYATLKMPTAEDRACVAGYLALAAGKQLINLPATITAGGEDDDGLPRLAVMWADHEWCYLEREPSGTVGFEWDPMNRYDRRSRRFTFRDALSARPMSQGAQYCRLRSHVPPIPPEHRPAPTMMKKFAVLWEVEEWAQAPAPPGDPALLRPIMGDLWTVEAVWDLTDLERLVLAGRT